MAAALFKAVVAYRREHEPASKCILALNNLALCQKALKQWERAIEGFTEVLSHRREHDPAKKQMLTVSNLSLK